MLDDGFQPDDFSSGNMRAYFAKERTLAEDYAEAYGDGILEVDIPTSVYDMRIGVHEVPYLSNPSLTEIPIPHSDFDVLNNATRRLIK